MCSEATLSVAGERKAGIAAIASLVEQADPLHEFPGVPVVKSSITIVKMKIFVQIKYSKLHRFIRIIFFFFYYLVFIDTLV